MAFEQPWLARVSRFLTMEPETIRASALTREGAESFETLTSAMDLKACRVLPGTQRLDHSTGSNLDRIVQSVGFWLHGRLLRIPDSTDLSRGSQHFLAPSSLQEGPQVRTQ